MWITAGPSQRNMLLRRKFLNLLNKMQIDEGASQVCDLSEFESVRKDLLNEEFWGARVHGEATTGSLGQLIDALNECCVFAYQHLLQQQQKQPDSVLKKSLMRCVPAPGLLFQGRLESKLRSIKEMLQLALVAVPDSLPEEDGLQSEGRLRPDSFSKEEDDQILSGKSWPERFVGFDEILADKDKMDEFINQKCGKTDGPAALAIVGMGGSGKTTLARKFCRACKRYRCIWLTLPSSEDTSIDLEELKIALLQKMMKQIITNGTTLVPGDHHHQAEDHQNSNKVDSMMRRIRKELIGVAYRIVIDNLTEDTPSGWFSWLRDLGSNEVCDGETFGDRLAHAFPKLCEGSIMSQGLIIVTSRLEDERVRKLVSNNDNIFRLDTPLPDEQCWETIEHQLEGDERALQIARQEKKVIVETSGGLPLAAVALGRALRSYVDHEDYF